MRIERINLGAYTYCNKKSIILVAYVPLLICADDEERDRDVRH